MIFEITLSIVAAAIMAIISRSSTSKGRVPNIIGLPWIGSALEFRKDSVTFMRRHTASKGPVFRTLMAGRRTVHITSNRLVSSIFRMDGKGVSATMPQTKLLFKIVGIQGEQERIQHLVHGALIPIMDRYLSPASLEFATAGYPALLSGRFTAPYEIGKIHTISLKDFVRNHLYGIGCSLVLGRGFPSDEAREPFWTFEDGSPRIIALPFFAKKALRSRERLVDIIKAHLQQTENNGFASSSEHFAEIITTLRGANTSDDVLARIVVAYMFALQTNTIWTAFWAIAYTLRDPEMYQRLRREVDDLVFSRHGNDINRVDASDLLKPESMPLMNSIVLETQRLCAMDVSFRLVEHDFTLSDDQGLPVHFNKGETLLPSAIAVHHDPTIFDSPYEFRGDRFIDNSGNPAKLDGKNGRLLSSYIFAFGGGVSLCKGRAIARYELKLFLLEFMHLFDVQFPSSRDLETSGYVVPPFDYVGMGTFRAFGDVEINVSRRVNHSD